MNKDLIDPAFNLVLFAKETLRRTGRPVTQAEIAKVVGSHHNQVGHVERKAGLAGYPLLIQWATALRDAGLGDAVLIVDGRGPRFVFSFPDGRTFNTPVPNEDAVAKADRLEAAIRKHRAATGHEMCWENDEELWAALGDGVEIDHTPPPWCDFMQRCAAYRASKDR